jgi:RHS repeat-associated protein
VTGDASEATTSTVVVPLAANAKIDYQTSLDAALRIDVVAYLTPPVLTWEYSHHPGGSRATRERPDGLTTSFVWSTPEPIPALFGEKDHNDHWTWIVYGPDGAPLGQYDGQGRVDYHRDQLGSTRLVTDDTGGEVAEFSYHSWGAWSHVTGNAARPKLGWTGQYLDVETGWYHLRNRTYDPTTGQFLTRDPIEAVTGAPYNYVNGDPANRTDPLGLDWSCFTSPGSCDLPIPDSWESGIGSDSAHQVRSAAIGVLAIEGAAVCALAWMTGCAQGLVWAAGLVPVGVTAYGVGSAIWHYARGECDPQDSEIITSGLAGSGVSVGQGVTPLPPQGLEPSPGGGELGPQPLVPQPGRVSQNPPPGRVRPGGVR